MSCPTVALQPEEITERLGALPHWELKDNALERVHTGRTYLDALAILNRIAEISEAADHHPDLSLNWKKLTVRYWTHTAGGVTELDFELARLAETVISGHA